MLIQKEVVSTARVWEHHIRAWDAGDLDAIMSDYSEESVLILNNSVQKGILAIRDVFSNLFELFSTGENTIDPAVIRGEVIYITWNFKPEAEHEKSYFGSDSFIVQNSVITYQTIASLLYQKYPVV